MDLCPFLVDAQEMHRAHPDTFDVPPPEMLADPQPGWMAKICDNDQRFWTKIVSVDGARITATVDNATGCEDRGYGMGATVQYERRHIYVLQTPKQSAYYTLTHLMQTGRLPQPTAKQQDLRAMIRYVPKHWEKDKDMFRQGARTPEEALGMPADPEKIVAHFRAQPELLQRAGLRADDIGIAYVTSHAEIRRHAGPDATDDAIDAMYHSLGNMSVQTTLFCTATND
jgi:hypothetical protein